MHAAVSKTDAPVSDLKVSAYTVPTDLPEADGTIEWDSTTLVLVEVTAAGTTGLGYTYADLATADFIKRRLAGVVVGLDAWAVPAAWHLMVRAVRNQGLPGNSAMAISAVDSALWDLKARLAGMPLVTLLGMAQPGAPVYGSGGFTSYTIQQLQAQLAGWVEQGIPRVKMKIGTNPGDDLRRVTAAREAIGPDAELFVDANGAYSRKQALHFAEVFADLGVRWFEEPVYHHDLEGLRLMRDRSPSIMDIAAGEYGYDLWYFRRMMEAGAVDVQQADASRCEGVSGFLQVGALCSAHFLPLSGHCAPSLHVHPACALANLRHLEYFHDHARIEHMLFDGALTPVDGALHPDLSRPGMGLEFKHKDAQKYAIA